MFDYITLVPPVRRLINDVSTLQVDLEDSTDEASNWIKLSVDGYAYPVASGVSINGVPLAASAYTVTKNLIKSDINIAAASEVMVEYYYVSNQDNIVIDFIGDTIKYMIQPIFNEDFGFGTDIDPLTTPPSGYIGFTGILDDYVFSEDTWTNETIDNDMRSLFVYGTALEILGVKITEAGDDAIYIKDGDTVIDTAASSREKSRGYAPLVARWKELLQIIQTNRFEGFTVI